MSQIHKTAKGGVNVFARLWRGHLSLFISYWVFGVMGNLLWGAALDLVGASPGIIRSLLVAGMLGYQVVLGVGIWRAADRYTGKKEWAFLAKCVVVVNTLLLISGRAT